MKFEEWDPLYEEILDYFAFDRVGDEEAARLLASLLPRDDLALLEGLCQGKTVTVCGNAPSLPRETGRIEGTVFAADAAADVLYSRGIRPDAVFTDLDGATDSLVAMNREGTVVVVHAHGDNISLLRHWVPKLPGPLVGTTQAAPFGGIHNFGGFSDGDRAAFAAHALGAARVSLVGFDLDDPDVDPVKRGKLLWARRLLALLGHDI
ncbi:6-hydroxymethylpterin diphosphokinase MptE-like protein [Methanofollis ethanolicus]|uniref:6-hydroxymethylpterin diphosphokinase MptE-like protein n=1 Tax=Methanofollis ethanolicus TaxID=488124 RepID=UPI00082EF5C3|nr:6-hydroxymethylpterin diphosphokinase MptE-like protein [Methanofollis ethanolicus]